MDPWCLPPRHAWVWAMASRRSQPEDRPESRPATDLKSLLVFPFCFVRTTHVVSGELVEHLKIFPERLRLKREVPVHLLDYVWVILHPKARVRAGALSLVYLQHPDSAVSIHPRPWGENLINLLPGEFGRVHEGLFVDEAVLMHVQQGNLATAFKVLHEAALLFAIGRHFRAADSRLVQDGPLHQLRLENPAAGDENAELLENVHGQARKLSVGHARGERALENANHVRQRHDGGDAEDGKNLNTEVLVHRQRPQAKLLHRLRLDLHIHVILCWEGACDAQRPLGIARRHVQAEATAQSEAALLRPRVHVGVHVLQLI
mmetsp:Transcript_18806/g.71191  ORF Transcript_18806/g.71191 Transcript_18806/m.71191 type:complete len:318 (+) Transcript_18806:3481-4434(+)